MNNTIRFQQATSFVGIRQSEFNVSYQTTFHLNNTTDTVFGITTYMSNNYHYDVTIDSKNRKLCLIKRIGSIEHIAFEQEINLPEIIKLRITVNEKYYSFFAEINNASIFLGQGECSFLASELTGTFTGVILGTFCTSKPCNYIKVRSIEYSEK